MVYDDNLTVELTSHDWLRIYKKNEDEAGTVILTQRRWREEEENIKHQLTQRRFRSEKPNIKPTHVKLVGVYDTNVGDVCKDLFTYISTHAHCDSLSIDNVTDGTEKNRELSCRLFEVLDRLYHLIGLDIRHTDLSEGGRQVLSSISHPELRVLTLSRNRLNVEGEELKATLTRLPQLRFLQLNDSGLGGEELLCGLTQLPSSSPLLQGLAVAGHDLSSGGDQLVQVVEALPQLRLLVISNCQLVSRALCSILEKINTKIEILTIDRNGPVTDRKAHVFDQLWKCKFLTNLSVSSIQFSESEGSQLFSLLSAQKGCLLVDRSDKHIYGHFIKHIDRIRDECLSL